MSNPLNRSKTENDLWRKLTTFPFDAPGVRRPLSVRLAEDQRWTADYTRRVLNEYRRFLFLTAVAGHTVCPSEDIDQAWHEHLTWTRLYWDELCGKILQYPLHHDPSGGGPAELLRHRAMYRQTLDSYLRVFNEPAPGDIWPVPEKRFASKRAIWRSAIRSHLAHVHNAIRWISGHRAVAVAIVPVFALGLGPFDLGGPDFLKFYIPLVLIAIATSLTLRFWTQIDGTQGPRESNLTPAEAACLAFGRPAAVNATIAMLLQEGILQAQTPRKLPAFLNRGVATFHAANDLPDDTDEVAAAVYAAASERPRTLADLQSAAATETAQVAQNLAERGYLVNQSEAFALRLWPVLILVAVAAIGVVKIMVGLTRDKPVGFLGITVFVVFAMAIVCAQRPWQTHSGRRLLDRLKMKYPASMQNQQQSEMSGSAIAMLAALYGATVLSDELFGGLKQAWQSTSTSGAGGDSGCSGSGCGGGGGNGGCGGCGGGGGD